MILRRTLLALAEGAVVHRLKATCVLAPLIAILVAIVKVRPDVRDGLLDDVGIGVAQLRRPVVLLVPLGEEIGPELLELRVFLVPEAVVPPIE